MIGTATRRKHFSKNRQPSDLWCPLANEIEGVGCGRSDSQNRHRGKMDLPVFLSNCGCIGKGVKLSAMSELRLHLSIVNSQNELIYTSFCYLHVWVTLLKYVP